MLVTSRPLDEYCTSFGLSRAGLRGLPGPLLDCPGGAAGLAAEARALGCRVVAADPLYAAPPAVLAGLALAGRDAMAARMRSTPQRYPSARHLRHDKYLRSWDRARELFAADRAAHPERYVAAELPRLPFADGTFALTLSSYLLFAYPERFGPDEQLAALLELVRVTDPAGEVRVHPLHDGDGRRCPHLDGLRAALGRHGVASEITVRPAGGLNRRVLRLRAVRRRQGTPGPSGACT
ncbi:hypothetical protein [Kitasatospora sp. DSM 101779]|uniref:hypothetical protein n=1 Tax=Kitasatospora sp. DSM 101779 TaxID=2853165 RepID=UPI0021D98024|nr:hypothetical protein [Kitasatospora sp. DSM 101779]MCU7823450.1 hypothetical protein [Kitasatospora sp. DSM 101779]